MQFFIDIFLPSLHIRRKLIQIYYVLIHFSFYVERLLSFDANMGKKREKGNKKNHLFVARKRYCYRWVVIYLAYFPPRSHNAWMKYFTHIDSTKSIQSFTRTPCCKPELKREETLWEISRSERQRRQNWMREIV